MNAFVFKSYSYDPKAQTVALDYAYADGPSFTETIHFPDCKPQLNEDEREALDKAMRGLHFAAGISYYKAYCPQDIVVETAPMAKEEADFFFKFYRHGLGEFSVENDIDLSGIIRFPVASNHHPHASELKLKEQSVVPIGGGKDSVVSLEAVKAAGRDHKMIAINAGRPILEVMDVAGGDVIHIKRTLDKSLFDLNDEGAMNGHVPITGILSFIMACGAILYDYDSVVMSNEGSASEGNMEFAGIEVNHQYSKSLEFELDFEQYVRRSILANFKYFSLLRPLNETGIAALFSTLDQYFETFKSCNRNFHINEGERRYGW
jgi:UDP-N-acetyl-alpha-D-muramoyl-L-alanyl-L-glutamate epimerase